MTRDVERQRRRGEEKRRFALEINNGHFHGYLEVVFPDGNQSSTLFVFSYSLELDSDLTALTRIFERALDIAKCLSNIFLRLQNDVLRKKDQRF